MQKLLHNNAQDRPRSTTISWLAAAEQTALVFVFGHKWQKVDVSTMSRYQRASAAPSSSWSRLRPPFTFMMVPLVGRAGADRHGFQGRFVIDLCSDHRSCLTCARWQRWASLSIRTSFFEPGSTRHCRICDLRRGESVLAWQERRGKHVLHGEVCPPGGPHLAAFGLHLHDRQYTALLSRWETDKRHGWGLSAGLAHGGAHRRGPFRKYKPKIRVQIQTSEGFCCECPYLSAVSWQIPV